MSTYVQRFPLSVTNIKAQIEVISDGSNNTINVTYTNVIYVYYCYYPNTMSLYTNPDYPFL